jgi:hypothetical protein
MVFALNIMENSLRYGDGKYNQKQAVENDSKPAEAP